MAKDESGYFLRRQHEARLAEEERREREYQSLPVWRKWFRKLLIVLGTLTALASFYSVAVSPNDVPAIFPVTALVVWAAGGYAWHVWSRR